MILHFDDWYYRYFDESGYDEYVIECQTTGRPHMDYDEYVTDQYENYVSEYQDMAYETFQDNKLFESGD